MQEPISPFTRRSTDEDGGISAAAARSHADASGHHDAVVRQNLGNRSWNKESIDPSTSTAPAAKKDKEPMLKQWLVEVMVIEDGDVNPDATVGNALARVWETYGNADGRFRVTRVGSRRATWSEDGDDPDEYDQLRFVCDYVAKGANGADARVKIGKVIEATGISVLNIDVTETASLRAADPYAVPEDLPSLEELRRRAGL